MANPPLHGIDDGPTGYGVLGTSESGVGTEGFSSSGIGVQGIVGSRAVGGQLPVAAPGSQLPPPIQAGVVGYGQNPADKSPGATYGVYGSSISGGDGVYGIGANGVRGDDRSGQGPAPDRPAGTVGTSTDNYGVFGSSANYDGVKGVSASPFHAGVSAINTTTQNVGQVPAGYALWAYSENTGVFAQGTPAGYFVGDVQVTGDLVLINSPASGDVAEDFDVGEDPAHAEPGTVLIIDSDGRLGASSEPYDTRVAGVISGAGSLRPAVVLQRIPSATPRSPVALLGKVFCKVDAAFGSIVAGDLLTTSTTIGHAMKVADRSKAIGAILGKALGPWEKGRGLIPILVSVR
jgi:hypothetical protein